MGTLVNGIAAVTIGVGSMVGGCRAGIEDLSTAAVEFGYATPDEVTAGDRLQALGTGVLDYGKVITLATCDNFPIWTPCDRQPNKVAINDSVAASLGEFVISIGGTGAVGYFAIWPVLAGASRGTRGVLKNIARRQNAAIDD